MQGGYFSYALLAALATALLVAAFTDLRRRQIDNWLNAAVALGAPLFWYASGFTWTQIGWQLALAGIASLVLIVLFALRMMGGGDVKLLAALALWVPPLAFAKLILMMSLIGGALSIAIAARNLEQVDGARLRNLLAYCAAAIWVSLCAYAVWRIATSQPLAISGLAEAVRLGPIGQWLVWGVLASGLLIGVAGALEIIRRQRKRLPIPYGVAISIAGLWMLAAQYFPIAAGGENLG